MAPIRYKSLEKGKPLVLFHTIRNRLEYSENVAEFLKINLLYILLIFLVSAILLLIEIQIIIRIFLLTQ